MRRFDTPRRASGTTGNGNPSQVQVGLHDVGGNALEPEIKNVVQAIWLHLTIDLKVHVLVTQGLHNLLLEVVVAFTQLLLLLRGVQFNRLGKGRNGGNILGAGPPLGFLVTTLDETWEADPITPVQETDHLGTIELVRRRRQHVNVVALDVDRQEAIGLNCVGVEPGLVILQDFTDLVNWHPTADLIVPHHDRDQDRVVSQGLLEVVQGDLPILIDG